MKKLIPLCLILTACAHKPIIIQPCVTEIPAEPPYVSDQLTGDAREDVKILAGSAIRLRAWGDEMRRLLEACR